LSLFLYAEAIRGTITNIDINGQGSEARLDPGAPLIIKGTFKAQNPKTDPTDVVQIILFLDDKFFKCVYNDVPAKEPNFTTGSFETKCTAPTEEGKYSLRAGYAYNWNWPEQAYRYLLAYPEAIETIGTITVGPEAIPTAGLLPAALIAMPIIGTIISMAPSKRR